jgi:NADH-quinone oxidoreductase subunit M
LRFNLGMFPDASVQWAPLIIVLSLIGIVYGAIVALVQPDLKKLVAYSSVSHMGFVTLGIFIFQEQGLHGAVMQMVAHGIITGALFLLVGVIYERTHDRTIAKMGGLAGALPVYSALLGFFVLASLALPGLAGFIGEFLVIIGAFDFWPIASAVAALAMMLGAAYLLWMYQRVVFGDLSEFLKGLGHHLTDMTRVEVATLAPLVVLAIGFGLFPGLLLELWQKPVTEILGAIGPAVLAR